VEFPVNAKPKRIKSKVQRHLFDGDFDGIVNLGDPFSRRLSVRRVDNKNPGAPDMLSR